MEKKVWLVTYNTADEPKRRMVSGIFDSREKADEDREAILARYRGQTYRGGSFLVDTEVSEHELR